MAGNLRKSVLFLCAGLGTVQLLSLSLAFAYIPSTLSSSYGDRAGRVTKWDLSSFPNGAIPYVVNPTKPAGSDPIAPPGTTDSDIISAVREALQSWEDVNTSAIKFSFQGATTQTNAVDLLNVVTLSPQGFDFGGSNGMAVRSFAPNAGPVRLPTGQIFNASFAGEIFDCDVLINPQNRLTIADTYPPSGTSDLRGTFVHEIGHCAGLEHTGIVTTVMYAFTSYPLFRRAPKLDDIVGVSTLYPDGSFLGTTGSISGRVIDSAGSPVFGAQVVAMDAATGVILSGAVTGLAAVAEDGTPRTFSSSSGNYRIMGLPPGTYTIYAEPLDGPGSATFGGIFRTAAGESSINTNFLPVFSASTVTVAAGQVASAPDLIVGTRSSQSPNLATFSFAAVSGGPFIGPGFATPGSSPTLSISFGENIVAGGNLVPGASFSFSGGGITIGAITVRTSDILLPLTVSSTVALGPRVLILNTSNGSSVLSGALTIRPTANPASVSALPFTDQVNTVFTTETAEHTPSCGNGSRSKRVAYQFTPTRSGTVTMDTFGSDYNTILSVWTGSASAFTEVACNDDDAGTTQSRVSFAATAGTTYTFLVTSFNNDGGTLVFHLTLQTEGGPIPTGDRQTFIPHSAFGGGFLTRRFFTNLTNTTNALTINRISQSGGLLESTTTPLQPNATALIADTEQQRSQPLTTQWLAIASQGAISASVLFDCCATGSQVTSAVGVLAQAAGTSFMAPFVFQRETSSQPLLLEGLAVANRSAAANTVTVQFLDAAGNQLSTDTLAPILAFGQAAFTVSELPGVSAQLQGRDTFLGSLVITGTQSFAPIYVGNLGGRLFSLPLMPSSSPENTAIIPHFVTGGGYVTQVFIKNLANSNNNVRIDFINQNGSVARTETVTLAGGQTIERTSGEASRTAPLSAQWLTVSADQPILVSALFDCCSTGPQVTSAVGVLAQPWGNAFTAPFVFQRETATQPILVQGVAVANRANASNAITVRLLDPAGTQIASDTLAPVPALGQTAFTVSDLPNVSAFLTGRNTFLGSLLITGPQPFSPVIVGNLGGRLFSLPLTAQ